ncbi:MAG TPA: cupin domain-containing protein [Vicinamibacterales bacterium]|jgi:quercetin dioxygenase-like cupin family protein|nr:cupin domain-containing protein [Vicinamibacterales bacterium]
MLTVMRIERWDPRREGAVTEAGLRRKVENYGYQISTTALEGGTVLAPHLQGREGVDAVISGIVKITLDGESAILTAGDLVYVPRGSVRRVEVVGSAAARCIEAVYAR